MENGTQIFMIMMICYDVLIKDHDDVRSLSIFNFQIPKVYMPSPFSTPSLQTMFADSQC
jgi:hypothetical protein